MDCLGTIAALASSLVLASTDPVIIATDAPFPSYTFLDADGTVIGFERDLMDQICVRTLMVCEWRLTTFDRLIPGVMSGEFDVVLGGMAVTDARRELVDFTQAYHTTDPVEWYIGARDAPLPSVALTVVQSGTVHEAHLRKLGYRYLSFSSEPEVLEALRLGKADLALGPFRTRTDIAEFIAANGFVFLYSDLIHDDGVAMAVCKGNNDLLDRLNTALDGMRADGTLAALESRWFE